MRHWFPIALGLLLMLALPGLALFVGDLLGYEVDLNAYLESHLGLTHHLPIPLAAGVALFLVPPLLIALYLLKLKRAPQVVPSTFLWKKSIEDLHVNRLLQWLRQNVLLLLQLLATLAILYGVLAPKRHSGQRPGKNYILLVDRSASMSAADPLPDRLGWAKAQALKEIDAASDDDQGMVIAFGASAETLQGYTNNRPLLRRVIESIRPTHEVTRLEEALALAESLANPTRSTENEAVRPLDAEAGKERQYAAAEGVPAEVHLFSDGRFPDVPDFARSNLRLTLHVPPRERPGHADNLAIVGMDAFRDDADPARLLAQVRLLNFRDAPASVTVILEELRGETARFLRQQTLQLPARRLEPGDPKDPGRPARDLPGEAAVRFELSGFDATQERTLRARLAAHRDALEEDDRAWLVLVLVRKARVLLVGDINPALRDALDSPANRTVCELTYLPAAALADRARYLDPARNGAFDLVIFEGCAPANEEAMPRANTLFIGEPPPPWHRDGAADALRVTRVEFPPVRGWSDRHPVMQGIRAWHELVIGEAFRMGELPARTPRLLESSKELPLMMSLSRGPYQDLVVAFPIGGPGGTWNTNWILRPGFPVFVRNVLFQLGRVRDATTEESLRPGQTRLLSPGVGVAKLEVTRPDGSKRTLERGARAEFAFSETDLPGVYTARWGVGQETRFAVNLFDPDESNLEPREVVQIGVEPLEAGATRGQPRELWRWFVLAALLLVLLEWWVYHKRIQV